MGILTTTSQSIFPLSMKQATTATNIRIHTGFENLLKALPLFAEEGPIHESVSEDDLQQLIISSDGLATPSVMVQMVRTLFTTFGLLNLTELASGRWAFVSFPASLMGRSLLASLAVPGQTLVDSSYWEQGSHRPDRVVEEQRWLLKELEQRRVRFHPRRQALAIRTVHVAWGIVKMNDRFLLRHREDKTRRDSKNYVLPGGRLNMSDLPADKNGAHALKDLHSPQSALAHASLQTTLARELEEELSLLPEHYQALTGRGLSTYEQVEGSGNKHALTQYNIVVFPTRLTEAGELRLLETINECTNDFDWFTLDELLGEQRSDGKQAFVNALVASAHDADTRTWLSQLPDSAAIRYAYTLPTNAIDIPGTVAAPFLIGKTGKEKRVEVSLTPSEWSLVVMAAWHALGLKLYPDKAHISTLDNGWLALVSQDAVSTATQLITKLDIADLQPCQLINQNFFRLSVVRQHLHLCASFFTFDLEANERVVVKLAGLQTDWGDLTGALAMCPVEPNMLGVVQALAHGEDLNQSTGLKLDNLARIALDNFKATKKLGLRKFLYTDDGEWCLSCRRDKAIR